MKHVRSLVAGYGYGLESGDRDRLPGACVLRPLRDDM
jgi:hypothetical protein